MNKNTHTNKKKRTTTATATQYTHLPDEVNTVFLGAAIVARDGMLLMVARGAMPAPRADWERQALVLRGEAGLLKVPEAFSIGPTAKNKISDKETWRS